MSALLEAAQRYAKSGVFVMPVRLSLGADGKKVPEFGCSWKTESSTDLDTVTAWFSNPRWNTIGINCDKSGLVVIDLDKPDAIAWAAALPATSRASTRKGQHAYYRSDPAHPQRNSASKLNAGVDVRAVGGMVFAPPSTYEGGGYAWIGSEPDWATLPMVPYELFEQVPASKPAPLPGTRAYEQQAMAYGADDPFADAGVAPRDRTFTPEQAQAFAEANGVADLRASTYPANVHHRLNIAALVLSHFDAFWSAAQQDAILLGAMAHHGWTEFDDNDRRTIADARRRGARDWKASLAARNGHGTLAATAPGVMSTTRRTDLRPFLSGTYEPPNASVGGTRDARVGDMDAGIGDVRLLYAGRWHTLIAPTGVGKSWWAVWHAAAEMRQGNTVAYAHFEEDTPVAAPATIGRLRAIGMDPDVIAERLVWLDCDDRWQPGEFAGHVPAEATLVILDGINAAATRHLGLSPDKPETVGAYRREFVTPASRNGAAVLSLGHPPKAKDRQDERHGFGSSAWLDEVDGVGFRLKAGKQPIGAGKSGSSALYCVKDRHGGVARHGDEGGSEGWTYLGQFVMDNSSGSERVEMRLTAPKRGEDGKAPDAIDALCDAIVEYASANGREWGSRNGLSDAMRAAKVAHDSNDLSPALNRLFQDGRAVRTGRGNSLAGYLTVLSVDLEEAEE